MDDAAGRHLFAGDDTYLPATFAMVESLPPERSALVVLEVGDDVGEQPVSWPPPHRPHPGCGATPAAGPTTASSSSRPSPGWRCRTAGGTPTSAGSTTPLAAVRATLIGRGLPGDAICAKAYRRLDMPTQDHGEPERSSPPPPPGQSVRVSGSGGLLEFRRLEE